MRSIIHLGLAICIGAVARYFKVTDECAQLARYRLQQCAVGWAKRNVPTV
jgi:hypothetical protein